MRLPWRRPKPAGEEAPDPAFDALVDVDPALGAGLTQAASAARALPGARWISIEHHPNPDGVTARLFPPGSSQPLDAPALRRHVEQTVRAALTPSPAWTMTPPATATGFAESLSPSQFDALNSLAELAATSRPPRIDEAALAARLLAFVLPEDAARTTAAAAIQRFGSYPALLAAPQAELHQVPGLGTHSVAALKLVHAAAIRLARAGVARGPVLDDPDRLAAYLAAALARARVEQFRILFLDANGMLRADEVQATGTVNHTPVYPREVVRRALELKASALILVHNHPSGDPEPSREDVEMTRQVQAAAATMGVTVRDHVIVGNGRWLSFRAEGLLADPP